MENDLAGCGLSSICLRRRRALARMAGSDCLYASLFCFLDLFLVLMIIWILVIRSFNYNKGGKRNQDCA